MSFHTNPILLSSVLEEDDYDVDLDSLSGQSAGSDSCSSVVSTNTASTGVSRITLKQLESIDDESLATKESRALVKLRFFLITVLFWSTAGVGLSIFSYFTEEIEAKFEEQYYEESTEIFRGVENAFAVAHGAIDSFALALCTRYSEWPFVTVPRFSARAEKLRNLASAVVVTNYHFVREDQRTDWEAYSAANSDKNDARQHLGGGHRSLENILRGESSAAADWTRDNTSNASLGREDSFLVRAARLWFAVSLSESVRAFFETRSFAMRVRIGFETTTRSHRNMPHPTPSLFAGHTPRRDAPRHSPGGSNPPPATRPPTTGMASNTNHSPTHGRSSGTRVVGSLWATSATFQPPKIPA